MLTKCADTSIPRIYNQAEYISGHKLRKTVIKSFITNNKQNKIEQNKAKV